MLLVHSFNGCIPFPSLSIHCSGGRTLNSLPHPTLTNTQQWTASRTRRRASEESRSWGSSTLNFPMTEEITALHSHFSELWIRGPHWHIFSQTWCQSTFDYLIWPANMGRVRPCSHVHCTAEDEYTSLSLGFLLVWTAYSKSFPIFFLLDFLSFSL